MTHAWLCIQLLTKAILVIGPLYHFTENAVINHEA
jgi:hypothetical protein